MSVSVPATGVAPAPRRAMQLARAWALGAAAVAMGLIAGFFYAYACSVMIGLARVDNHTFVSTMQWINATVRNGWFAVSFFGALPLAAIAAILHLRRDARPVLPWTVAAVGLYAVAFAITMGISVPLNDELAAAGDPSAIADLSAVRAAYETTWVEWNIARTIAATAALACLVRALMVRARHAPARPTGSGGTTPPVTPAAR